MNRFRLLIILVVILVAPSLHGQIQGIVGETLPLYYDPATGNLTIDATEVHSGRFVSYRVRLPPDGWQGRPIDRDREPLFLTFNEANHTPFMPSIFSPISRPKEISESAWPESVEAGVYSLGNVLPPGLDQDSDFLSTMIEVEPWARGDLETDIWHPLELVYSPSPFPPLNTPDGNPVEEIDWALQAALSYDPRDGSLILDTMGPQGGTVWGYQLQLYEDLIRVDEFQSVTDGMFATIKPHSITELTRIDAGRYDLGTILPVGLNETELLGIIDDATFLGELGHGAGALDMNINGRALGIRVVPEPTALGLFITTLMLAPLIRRKV